MYIVLTYYEDKKEQEEEKEKEDTCYHSLHGNDRTTLINFICWTSLIKGIVIVSYWKDLSS